MKEKFRIAQKNKKLSRNQTNQRSKHLDSLPLPTPLHGQDVTQIFKRSLIGLNSEFSFSGIGYLNKAKEPSLPHYLPIAGRRIINTFPKGLELCEMQSALSRI